MNHPRVPARLLARESLPGITEALGNLDGWLLRDSAHWLITRHEGVITVGRVAADPSEVLADRATWTVPAADGSGTYCSPLPDGALAIGSRQAVTVYEADGTVRWEHHHETWLDSPLPWARTAPTVSSSPTQPTGSTSGQRAPPKNPTSASVPTGWW
ncbi:hypothetical protein R1T08_36505 [Streptomyces sp. SBC-4]|nr:hypothetical protein [Streptomyces sp. SBC-4]MDV5149478.1 hypothetical protein [Streptomyces sp. SBC-4]